MFRRAALAGLSVLLLLAGCAGTGAEGQANAPAADDPGSAFASLARQAAQRWSGSEAAKTWGDGFVPLQALTVPPEGATFNEATKQAFAAGWYRMEAGMPRERGGRTGEIRYAGGDTQSVPLTTVGEAFAAIDQGDPPPCAGPTVPPRADAPKVQDNTVPDAKVLPSVPGGAPDGSVSQEAPKPCVALTITGVSLGSTKLLTSRGEAQVPAWLFAVRELGGQVARVAVDQSVTASPPAPPAAEPAPGASPTDGLVAAQNLTTVSGAQVGFRLGVGACDKDIRPLFFETEQVVVLGGSVTRADGVCTDQLLLHPATVRLAAPVGARPVLDALTGQVLTIAQAPPD